MTSNALPQDTLHLVDRYVALWNEADTAARRRVIGELWAEEGTHVLEPPAAMRAEAAALGFPSPELEVRGFAELEFRVARAYDEFVGSGRFTFRSRGDGARLGRVVKFHWEMMPTDGGPIAAVGLEILVLDGRGRILADHQFIEA